MTLSFEISNCETAIKNTKKNSTGQIVRPIHNAIFSYYHHIIKNLKYPIPLHSVKF